ncbi:MAG TPA: 2'-5' RNA ligase family protein [Thermomicrobiales bacterium]|jgi:2'-5' RNA ligase
MTADAPLILTLALDAATQAHLDALREAHFPPARNYLAAHLTLFHHLPAEERDTIAADLAEVCAARGPLALTASGVLFFGRGVAYGFAAPDLDVVRAELARRWWPWLTAQDRQKFRAHVTVQNKVAPAQARALHEQLSVDFAPFTATGEALLLWRYLGGPWESVAAYPFGESEGPVPDRPG